MYKPNEWRHQWLESTWQREKCFAKSQSSVEAEWSDWEYRSMSCIADTMATSRIVIKRYLTQSEKDREYLKRGVIPDERFLGSRVAECSQNIVETRKLKNELRHLDKQQRDSITKINAAQHVMKLNFRKFRKIPKDDAGSYADDAYVDDDFIQAGFAFHSNGERRNSHKTLISKSICKLKHDVDLLQESHSPAKWRTKSANHVDLADATDSVDETEMQMHEIQKLMENINSTMAKKRALIVHTESRGKPQPYLRAHQNDYFWHLPTGSARRLKNGQTASLSGLGHEQDEYDCHALCGPAAKIGPYKNTARSRAQCVACEFRLKQNGIELGEKTSDNSTNVEKTKPPRDPSRQFLVTGQNSFHICSISLKTLENYEAASSHTQLSKPSYVSTLARPGSRLASPIRTGPHLATQSRTGSHLATPSKPGSHVAPELSREAAAKLGPPPVGVSDRPSMLPGPGRHKSSDGKRVSLGKVTIETEERPVRSKEHTGRWQAFTDYVQSSENSLHENFSWRVEPPSSIFVQGISELFEWSQKLDHNFYSKMPFRAPPFPSLHKRFCVDDTHDNQYGAIAPAWRQFLVKKLHIRKDEEIRQIKLVFFSLRITSCPNDT